MKPAISANNKAPHYPVMLFPTLALAGLIFYLDTSMPFGVAASTLYIPFVLCSLWLPGERSLVLLTGLATLLVVCGSFYKHGSTEIWTIVTNRALIIAALWLVAAQVRLRESGETAFRVAAETIIDGLITINDRGIVKSFNPAAERLFGYTREEVVGRNVKMLMPEPYQAEHDGYLNSYMTTGKAKIIGIGREVSAKRKDGSVFPMDLGINEMRVGGKRMFVGTIRDISERKTAERLREEYTARLENTNKDLDAFVYVASHDLKSPLRAIDNLSKWLSEDLQDIDGENRERLQKMRGRVQRMEKLLDDILEYSRAGRKKVVAQPVEAEALVVEVAELLNVPEGFRIVADASLDGLVIPRMPLQQIFHNLISNAIKHHDKPTGTITVSAMADNRGFTFHVADDGPGIPQEYHEKVFEMFQTLRPRDAVEGSGMGLAIIRKIINRAGGEITVRNLENRGACFSFLWPHAATEQQMEAA